MKMQKVLGFMRRLLTEGPLFIYYAVFGRIYHTRTLRNKAASCPHFSVRHLLLRLSGIQIGRDARIQYGVLIHGVGRRPSAVSIGARAAIGPYVTFITSSYPGNSLLGKHPQLQSAITPFSPIVVEEDVWIGAHATILPGVRLGRGCIVGAGSVVTRDVPSFAVTFGVPARIARQLDPMEKGME